MSLRNILLVLLVVAVLAPVSAQAQRVCFSFASDDNSDGPTFFGVPPFSVFDGSLVDPSGSVDVRLLIQPFCNSGPLFSRKVQMLYRTEIGPYQAFPFLGGFADTWNAGGLVRFIDGATGTVFLDIVFNRALMTSWSTAPNLLGPTATVQDSEDLDPNIRFIAGPELLAILGAAGYPAALLDFGEDFAFTMTNIREPGAGGGAAVVPVNPATGELLDKWVAEGSFSAAAGL
jgi:hypothetical protein